jgi:hypothetical protein
VIPRGLYKQGPWPLDQRVQKPQFIFSRENSPERGPLNGSFSRAHTREFSFIVSM